MSRSQIFLKINHPCFVMFKWLWIFKRVFWEDILVFHGSERFPFPFLERLPSSQRITSGFLLEYFWVSYEKSFNPPMRKSSILWLSVRRISSLLWKDLLVFLENPMIPFPRILEPTYPWNPLYWFSTFLSSMSLNKSSLSYYWKQTNLASLFLKSVMVSMSLKILEHPQVVEHFSFQKLNFLASLSLKNLRSYFSKSLHILRLPGPWKSWKIHDSNILKNLQILSPCS